LIPSQGDAVSRSRFKDVADSKGPAANHDVTRVLFRELKLTARIDGAGATFKLPNPVFTPSFTICTHKRCGLPTRAPVDNADITPQVKKLWFGYYLKYHLYNFVFGIYFDVSVIRSFRPQDHPANRQPRPAEAQAGLCFLPDR
jgi:hypothetical protein